MSDLTRERDWMRRCAEDTTRPDDERAMWARQAAEFDAYLAHDPEVVAKEPTSDDVALWEDDLSNGDIDKAAWLASKGIL